MAKTSYIISITDKAILRKDEERYEGEVINLLKGNFGPVREIQDVPWYLSNGINEKRYYVTTPELSPEREKEFREGGLKNLREAIEATHRNFRIFKLEEIEIPKNKSFD